MTDPKKVARNRLWRERHRHPCAECGKPIGQVSQYCKNCTRLGERGPAWRGGIRKTFGYIYILSPDHPYATEQGYVFAHRLAMESHLGRVLLPTEVVHHINGKRDDNRIENLMLFANGGEHVSLHRRGSAALALREGAKK